MTELTEYGSTETLTYIQGVNVSHEFKVKRITINTGMHMPESISEQEIDEITYEKKYTIKNQYQKHKYKTVKFMLATPGKVMITTENDTCTLENIMNDYEVPVETWYTVSNIGTWPVTLLMIECGHMCDDIDIDTRKQ